MKEFKFKIGGTDYAATVEELEGGKLQVNLNGKAFEVEMPQSERKVQRPAAPAPSAGGRPVNAPLPGVVSKINAKVGDKVSTGDTILVLEAMKMENNITADSNGTIKAILCKEGDQVQSGQALVELD